MTELTVTRSVFSVPMTAVPSMSDPKANSFRHRGQFCSHQSVPVLEFETTYRTRGSAGELVGFGTIPTPALL